MRAFSAWRGAALWPLPLISQGCTFPSSTLLPLSHSASVSTFTKGTLEFLLQALTEPTDPKYATHVPLTILQKGALAVTAGIGAFSDPRRADLVAVVGETTGVPSLRSIRNRMLRSAEGRALLEDRPRVTDEAVAHAWDLPPHTFGGAYAAFMGARGFRADERPAVRFIDDPELAWVAARAREVHDFWHVLFGCHTDVFGETALKALEFMQTGLPMTAMAVVAGEWRLRPDDRATMNQVYLPWAMRAGARAADLMTLYYERHFEEDLETLREKWRISPAPEGRATQGKQTNEGVDSAAEGEK